MSSEVEKTIEDLKKEEAEDVKKEMNARRVILESFRKRHAGKTRSAARTAPLIGGIK